VEAFWTPPATEYDSASSVGDHLEVISLAGTDPEMEEVKHLYSEAGMESNVAIERAAEETEAEADGETENEGRMQPQYRGTERILADMRKPGRACGAGLGRDQTLWSFVFS